MSTQTLDLERVGSFAQEVGGMLAGGATAAMMLVGDRLGLYSALASSGPVTSAELADATGTAERYVREWLAQQAAVGFVDYEEDAQTFSLPPEHAAVLATDDSPASMIGAAPLVSGLHGRTEALAEAFRTGEGIAWADQDPLVFESTERFFRVGYRTNLIGDWIPALDGIEEKLRAGSTVVDIGCGRGAPVLLLAEEYPESTFVGYDVHEPSITTATQRAQEAGVGDRVRFRVGSAQECCEHDVDIVTFFDAFHDLGDPVGAAAHARRCLSPDGTLVLIEPLAGDSLSETLRTAPLAAVSLAASTFLCTPCSLSQPVGLALGGAAGPARLTDALKEAGFGRVRVVAKTMVHMVLAARV